MLEIKVNNVIYQVEIKVNKYGAILEIKKDNEIWYQSMFDLSMVKGSLSNHIIRVIEQQEKALKG